MKRNTAIFLAVAMLMSFASCGWVGNRNDNPVYNSTNSSAYSSTYNSTQPANPIESVR